MFDLTNPIFFDADKAREHLGSINWPNGPVCPHCGETEKLKRLEGQSHRAGLIQCNNNACLKNFTVTVGTVFERSKVPLNTWVYATHLLTSSKKGISSHQLHRVLEVQYKTAWFLAHRIREAMRVGALAPMGGAGAPVEVDETYYVSFEAAGQHIGLVPGGGPQGMTSPVAYWHVPDIEAKLAEVTAAGATVKDPARDVGGGRLVATVTDPDGNVLGLLQDR